MVVVALVAHDGAASQVGPHQLERIHRPDALGYRELMLDLPAESTPGIPDDRDREAALTVCEAGNPLRDTWSFLLIVRTERFVTNHVPTLRAGYDTGGTVGSTDVPANSRLHSSASLRRGATPWLSRGNLRTVIVTAAVYWGLESKLRHRSG